MVGPKVHKESFLKSVSQSYLACRLRPLAAAKKDNDENEQKAEEKLPANIAQVLDSCGLLYLQYMIATHTQGFSVIFECSTHVIIN